MDVLSIEKKNSLWYMWELQIIPPPQITQKLFMQKFDIVTGGGEILQDMFV